MDREGGRILVLNSGSSSLKFKLFRLPGLTVSARGLVESIGGRQTRAVIQWSDGQGPKRIELQTEARDHSQAISVMGELFKQSGTLKGLHELAAIGHRVVHGGERFRHPVLVDAQVLEAVRSLIPLAPLHNPANLLGIEVAMEHAPDVPQVAVFDTAFHQGLPPHAYLYAIPYQMYQERHIRRYGFHGTSHAYVSRAAAEFLGRPLKELSMITLHLGNGASAAAVKGGRSIDTSMGFTPLEGLIMGTRSGDLDPAVIFYLAREFGMGLQELDEMLNKKSGLKGICGDSDMRAITRRADEGDRLARTALEMFCYRIRKYIGAYMAALEGADCLVFTGGIGENSPVVRRMCCQGLEPLGIELDHDRNLQTAGRAAEISLSEGRVRVLVIPTDEELEIARQTLHAMGRA